MIKESVKEVRQNIIETCVRCGRNPEEITLVAVSKTRPCEDIKEAIGEGVFDFGENKVQELTQKFDVFHEEVRFHMIGHLQRNKVRQLIGNCHLIHSVDSVKLALELEKEGKRMNRCSDILLEVNVAKEESKFGFFPEEVEQAILQMKNFSNISIRGLMTVAPFAEVPEENREIFKTLFQLSVDISNKNIDNVSMHILSMGMSNDYKIAIEEGSTIVRIGTDIFGIR